MNRRCLAASLLLAATGHLRAAPGAQEHAEAPERTPEQTAGSQVKGLRAACTNASQRMWTRGDPRGVLCADAPRDLCLESPDCPAVAPSDATRALLQSFRVCGQCAGPEDPGGGAGEPDRLVRVGEPDGDGGYVMCAKTLRRGNVGAGFSVGIRDMDGWGAMLSERSSATVYQYDCTLDGRQPPRCPESSPGCKLIFNSFCLAANRSVSTWNQYLRQYLPLKDMVSMSHPGEGRDLVMKMDCESCEWDVFDEMSEPLLQRFTTLAVEFHSLRNAKKHPQYARVMHKLLKYFEIVHTHGSNCSPAWRVTGENLSMPEVVEVTFVRKDLAKKVQCTASEYLPDLDRKNCVRFPDYTARDFALGPAGGGAPGGAGGLRD